MIKHYKPTFAPLVLLLSALILANAATAQLTPNYVRPRNPITEAATPVTPKIAFVGDWLTTGWSATFPANWINISSTLTPEPAGTLAQQLTAAVALKPSTIHIMIGSGYWDDDASYNLVTAELVEDLTTAIVTAQNARIPLFVGMEPVQFVGYNGLSQMDLIVYAVATRYGVPIINYSGAFGTGQLGGPGNCTGQGTGQAFGSLVLPTNTSIYSPCAPTPAGYSVMTMMAQTAFATVKAQPKSVYLQDTLVQGNECGAACNGTPNVNTVSPGNLVAFYPVITYTNGVTQQAGLNTNFITGSSGTWTSSNPVVGFVNQSGEFWAFSQGTTTVKFTLPNGVWNEWIMYVGAPFPG
jgi:hypothetical protein